MKLYLMRTDFLEQGIFGELHAGDDSFTLQTLEHAYKAGDTYIPKIPHGTYTCVRGMHRLHGMDHDFETFEITGVEGHDKLLFHCGNFNKDSEGCVLLGLTRIGKEMLSHSRDAFDKFMRLQEDEDFFALTVY